IGRASGWWIRSSTHSSTSGGLAGFDPPPPVPSLAPKACPGVLEVGEVINLGPFVVADRNGAEANARLHHPLEGILVVALGVAGVPHRLEGGPEDRERQAAHLLHPDGFAEAGGGIELLGEP